MTKNKESKPKTLHAQLSVCMRHIVKLEAAGTNPGAKKKAIDKKVAAYRKKLEDNYKDPTAKVAELKEAARRLTDKIASALA